MTREHIWPTRFAELMLDRPRMSQVAEAADVDPSFISKVAAGKRRPSPKVQAAAAEVLGMSAAEIFPEWDIA